MPIIKTRFFKIYPKPGVTNLAFARKRTGVYFIKENDKLVYIGSTPKGNDVHKTLTRHFQTWNAQQYVTTYVNKITNPRYSYSARIIFCTNTQAARIEKYFIKKLRPRDNDLKYERYKTTESMENLAQKIEDLPFTPISEIEEIPF